jgi:diguanylate cyclase (GGDEF)-like protein
MDALRRAAHWPDHYYWLTAMLAARDFQRTVSRMVAAVLLLSAAISVVATLSPTGPVGVASRVLSYGIGVVCVMLATIWLRNRWPSRNESLASVIVLSICVAVSCLNQSQPLSGVLGCTVFALVAGYAVLFHSARLLWLIAGLALLVGAVLCLRIALAGNLALAACAMAIVVTVNLLSPLSSYALVRMFGVAKPNSEIDALTGLFNRDAYYRATAELLSIRGRLDDRYLVIVLISLDNFGLLVETNGYAAGDAAVVRVAQALRETTRGNAIVAHSIDGEFLITDTFPSTNATALIERVRGSVALTPPRLTASIGVVCTPLRELAGHPPDAVLDELLTRARTAMTEARRAGGNQARFIESPRLAALEDQPDSEGLY